MRWCLELVYFLKWRVCKYRYRRFCGTSTSWPPFYLFKHQQQQSKYSSIVLRIIRAAACFVLSNFVVTRIWIQGFADDMQLIYTRYQVYRKTGKVLYNFAQGGEQYQTIICTYVYRVVGMGQTKYLFFGFLFCVSLLVSSLFFYL